jgi:uroporphyrinogen-III decarboxylase
MLPRLKKLGEHCRAHGVHYIWRTDGNIWAVSDMIFEEAGIPGYGEVDWDATMEAGRLRERYPDLVIWGNLSADKLRRGSRQEVEDHAKAALDGSKGRGYFHGCSNAILPGTPPENVWAMMEVLDGGGE